MKSIFLTGEVQTGKSTVIQKVLLLLPSLVYGGFRTVSAAPITKGAMLDVFIEKAWEETTHDADHLVGSRLRKGLFIPHPEVFDAAGVEILASKPAGAALILMDELGTMENDSKLFQKAVMDTLDGPLPVIGVIKPKHTDFLDMIRTHPRSTIFEVTEENRDILPSRIAELLLNLI